MRLMRAYCILSARGGWIDYELNSQSRNGTHVKTGRSDSHLATGGMQTHPPHAAVILPSPPRACAPTSPLM